MVCSIRASKDKASPSPPEAVFSRSSICSSCCLWPRSGSVPVIERLANAVLECLLLPLHRVPALTGLQEAAPLALQIFTMGIAPLDHLSGDRVVVGLVIS